MEVIEHLKKVAHSSPKIQLAINWHYQEEDEDILDSGKEIEKMIGVKMDFIPYS
jgi:hypothetical protein